MDRWAYVSTSRSKNIAEKFATSDNTEEGYVYVIDEEKLTLYQVVKHEIKHHTNIHEHEVLLKSKESGALPEEIISEKYSVQPKSVY
jgi:hypothetical protein